MNITALIPARSGSKRIPGKNIKDFFGHPLLAHTVSLAVNSGVYNEIVVSTDDALIGQIANNYGATGWVQRPQEIAEDCSLDIEWIKHVLSFYVKRPDILCILRPTNPFRTKKMLVEAMDRFIGGIGFDSMRAVEKVSQHPNKMWQVQGNCIEPVLNDFADNDQFTKPTQSLPEYYVQNGSLEIIWTRTIEKYNNVCGGHIMPYFTEGYEGFDINTPEDFILAEELVKRGLVKLPEVKNDL